MDKVDLEHHDNSIAAVDAKESLPSIFSTRLKQYVHVSDHDLRRTSPRLHKSPLPKALEDISSEQRATSTRRKRLASSSTVDFVVECAAASPLSPKPKKRRLSSKYAPPSRYTHLSPLVDILEPNLICVFVGVNPGIQTAQRGHAYAHPSNLFWKLLHTSGCTDRRCKPEEDRDLPRLYSMGNTNIVERPTKDQAELSKEEMVAGTAKLEKKFQVARPEAVCIVGKGIWEAIWKFRYGRTITKADFHYGWQDERENMGKDDKEEDGPAWKGARVYVTCSTSGASASLRPAEKEVCSLQPRCQAGDWRLNARARAD